MIHLHDQCSGWNDVLLNSKYNLVTTAHFTRMPDPEEWQLIRVLEAWKRILNRCLDTLEAVDHKDVLKWWASPKNEAASQHPFQKPQNQQTLVKYSLRWQSFLCYVYGPCPRTIMMTRQRQAWFSLRSSGSVSMIRCS